MAREVKCVVVGDAQVGKSTLLTSFWNSKTTPSSAITSSTPTPNPSEGLTKEFKLDGNFFNLTLRDSPNEARPVSYSEANIFLLCFSVVCPVSLANVRDRWIPELRHDSPSTPILLVGTKTDLRHSSKIISKLVESGHQPVYEKAGVQLARKVGVANYVECCGLNTDEVMAVLNESIRCSKESVGGKEEKSHSRKEKCTIM